MCDEAGKKSSDTIGFLEEGKRKAMSDDKVLKYEGKKLDVFWDGGLCIHVAECGRAEGPLFEGGRKPWCEPDFVDNDSAKAVCERCPSGALTYRDKEGGAEEVGDLQNTVVVQSRGPLFVRGQLRVMSGGEGAATTRAALCRCGHSNNKPYCDNAHEGSGFSDHGAVGTAGDPDAELGGELEIKPAKNGPLLFAGNFAVKSSSGRVAFTGKKGALCRCGQSSNKPFCDGTHSKVGFLAE
jgi:CDGSH-type Zn-finger protein/uncharacterized Fe-S cluster protein YjdI